MTSSSSPTAFITGLTGQDGAYLARLLLSHGAQVHGMVRRSSLPNTARLSALGVLGHPRLHLHYGDVTDASCIVRLLAMIRPDEIYNLAAQSDVAVSFELPATTAQANLLGAVHLLEAMRALSLSGTRYYQASTSEIYGRVQHAPQDETTPFMPCSPYGVAKLAAYWTVVNYRDLGFHASNGILFNHESPLRGEMFVSRKVARAVAEIRAGRRAQFTIGNLDARRDWGHAQDFVEGIVQIVRHRVPGDYVLATGESYSVREFITRAFAHAGMPVQWRGSGTDEVAVDAQTGVTRVCVDAALLRPHDIQLLQGNPAKARRELGFEHRTGFAELVREMVEAELVHAGVGV